MLPRASEFAGGLDGISAPPELADCLELVDAKGPALVPGLGARLFYGFDYRFALGLIDGRGVKVFVQQDHQNGIELFLDVDASEALTRLAVREKAATLDLEPSEGAAPLFRGIEARIPRRCELDPENAGRLVLRNLARDSKGFSRQLTVPLRKALRFVENLHYRIIRAHFECRLTLRLKRRESGAQNARKNTETAPLLQVA